MNLRSIGVRLAAWYAVAFCAALLALGSAVWFTVRQSLYDAVDDSLRDRARGIERFLDDHEARLGQPEVQEEFLAHGDLFRVFDQDGRWIHTTAKLQDLPPPMLDAVAGSETAQLGGAPLRLLTDSVALDGRRYVVQVAAPLDEIQRGFTRALWILLPMLPLVLALASVGGYWMSRRALTPVDAIARTARSLSADTLSQRLVVPRTGDELERLSTTLNDMLARLESAFTKIARFTADASHELRTPLALIRTTAEVALRGSQPPAELRSALEQVIAEVERTSHLVENLLLIAKADSGEAQLQRRPVDLVQSVGEACAQASVLARVKGIELETRLPDAAIWITGDAAALRRLFLILLDNAVKYTPAGGRSEVSLTARGSSIVGSVSDTGIGIPPADLPHVFDRFYRVDRARSREQGGAGLGLAIGRWIAEAHGGTLTVHSALDRGSTFSVELPAG